MMSGDRSSDVFNDLDGKVYRVAGYSTEAYLHVAWSVSSIQILVGIDDNSEVHLGKTMMLIARDDNIERLRADLPRSRSGRLVARKSDPAWQ